MITQTYAVAIEMDSAYRVAACSFRSNNKKSYSTVWGATQLSRMDEG